MSPVISGLRVNGRLFSVLIVACSLCWLAGCGKSEPEPISARSSQYQVADSPRDERQEVVPSPVIPPTDPVAPSMDVRDSVPGPESPADAPPSTDAEPPAPPRFDPADHLDLSNLDPDNLPNSAAKLLALLEVLQSRRPSGQTPQEQMEDFLSIHFTRLKAAEKLWELAEDQQSRISAVQTKMDALRIMSRLEVTDTEKELHKYCRELLEHEDADIAFLARLMLFGLAMDDLSQGMEVDIESMLEELTGLADAAEQNPNTFSVLSEAAGVFFGSGHRGAALEAYRTIGQKFSDSPDEQVAAEAVVMLERVRILEAELDLRLQAVAMGEHDSEGPLLETITALLGSDQAGMGTLIEMGHAATILEMTDHYDLARQVYEKIAAAFQQHPDDELAETAAQVASTGLKHVDLVGQPLQVTGVKLDGSPFDWSAYEGKVVLVSFWTWTVPCLDEIGRIIIPAYERYRDQGFAVVGINLDEDTRTVERFMDMQPLPWPVLVSADPENQGPENPLAVHCGVDPDRLPFAVLLDREGKVVALHARQNRLHEKLEELLGPPSNGIPEAAP